MTTTTRNAAERLVLVAMTPELVDMLSRNGWDFGERGPDGFHMPTVRITNQYRDALAAERRATVDRIRERLASVPDVGSSYVKRTRLLAILDEEAAR